MGNPVEFVVLPDHPAADEVAGLLPDALRKNTLYHHSGRPWVVGDWAADEALYARAGRTAVVLLGPAHTTEPRLRERLGRMTDLRQLDAVVADTAGCFHLIASFDGTVRAQGTLSGARQLLTTRVSGVTVAANRVTVLAGLRELTLCDEQLVQHLLDFGPPWPLTERSVWREADPVPFAHCLNLRPDGSGEQRRWWTAPEAEVPASIAAPAFHGALLSAVAARSGPAPALGCDLSGGMDSTSLCFLAGRQPGRLVTVRRQLMDPKNCDDAVAARAAGDLPDAEHIVLGRDTAPLYYDASDRTDLAIDEPPPFVAMTRHMEEVARVMASYGVTRHLQGHGSDELAAAGTTAYMNTVLRRRPLRSLTALRLMRAKRRWSLATTLRVVRPFPPYGSWLGRSAGGLGTAADPESEVGWEPAPRLPFWVPPGVREPAAGTIRRAAATGPAPLAPEPVQHEILRCIRVNGHIVRFANTLADRFGVSFEAPFLDDRVVGAALSVRFRDRYVPGRHKPVLAAALRGTVPDYVLDRTTKSHFTMDVYEGRRRNLESIRAMFEDSRLVARGLVDAKAVRRVLTGVMPDPMLAGPFEKTIALEAWLRSVPERIGPRAR
ncbi:asparagine synthase-related protein [Streptomyces sp. NPDC006798]|uniref:asparagine synthase-related protein n=1 Tax=Streptomyces sp. NPDC006798 TaxID=3155462 RepID=UPI0033C17C0D